MSESIRDIVDIGLEGVLVILLLTISYKIYKMKCDFSSSCFKKDDNAQRNYDPDSQLGGRGKYLNKEWTIYFLFFMCFRK